MSYMGRWIFYEREKDAIAWSETTGKRLPLLTAVRCESPQHDQHSPRYSYMFLKSVKVHEHATVEW